MAFLFAPAAISISFPSQKTRVFYPGDVVSGVVHLRVDVDSKGKHAMEKVVVQLGSKMVTTFAFRPTITSASAAQARDNAAQDLKEATEVGGVKKVGASQDGNGVELYREETELYSTEQTIWESSSQPPSGDSLLDRPPLQTNIPFAFVLPPSFNSFPPSFEGGSRAPPVANATSPPMTSDPWTTGGKGMVKGHSVAQVEYYIHVTGKKYGIFSINERTRLPFTFRPSPTVDLSTIPPALSENDLPLDHPPHLPPPAPSHWNTTTFEHSVRDGWPWSKKGKLTLKLSLPPLPSGLPLSHPIPFHLHISSQPSLPSYPSTLTKVNLTLNRTVFALARGSGQFIAQRGSKPFLTVDLSEGEKGMVGSREIVAAGVLEISGKVDGVEGEGVSFGTERTRGMLGCEHHISLHVPIKGLGNDINIDKFISLVVGSGFDPTQLEALEEKRRVEVAALTIGKGGGYSDREVEMSEKV